MGKASRDKGSRYEVEIVNYLWSNGLEARKVSGMYTEGPDIRAFGGRYIEARRRKDTYQSMNQIVEELNGDASLYWTRLDGQTDHIIVMHASTLLDMLGEADDGDY